MAETRQHDDERDSTNIEPAQEKFKREGPPATGGTGETVEEMNKAAADSLVQNIEPHESVD